MCIRGREDRDDSGLGYAWLPKDEVFPFYELRAAAVDLRRGRRYNHDETLKRVCAQLDTLIAAGIRHAVLSAFGCGAFLNPARDVADAYHEALKARKAHFDMIAFAIFHPGKGPDNYAPFAAKFASPKPTPPPRLSARCVAMRVCACGYSCGTEAAFERHLARFAGGDQAAAHRLSTEPQ